MKSERIGYLLLLLVAIFVISSAALSAQNVSDELAQSTAEATMEGTPEIIFTDGRINNAIILGEFGIFCEDSNGDPAGTFDNGGRIAVYGSNGEQYIFAEEEAPRQYSDMAMMDSTDEPNSTSTREADDMMTPLPAILLGQAQGVNGVVQLFLVGDNEFRLRGFLPDGKGFNYGWTGCTGNIRIDTFEGDFDFITTTPVATLSGMSTARPTLSSTLQPTLSTTMEVTAEVTTSP